MPFLDRIKQAFAPVSNDDVTNKKYVDDLAATKAALVHGHGIGDVTNLQTALDGKAAGAHGHAIDDVASLQDDLNGKAALHHTHETAEIIGGGGAPTPNTGGGVGHWQALNANNTCYLPSGGTWAYFGFGVASGEAKASIAGAAAGGSTIFATGVNGQLFRGFCWRIA